MHITNDTPTSHEVIDTDVRAESSISRYSKLGICMANGRQRHFLHLIAHRRSAVWEYRHQSSICCRFARHIQFPGLGREEGQEILDGSWSVSHKTTVFHELTMHSSNILGISISDRGCSAADQLCESRRH